MADTRLLLQGLEEYRISMRRHLIEVRTEFSQLQRQWHVFSTVYEGDSADQFRAHWVRTAARFEEYVTRGDAIAAILDERIEFLRATNRTEAGLG